MFVYACNFSRVQLYIGRQSYVDRMTENLCAFLHLSARPCPLQRHGIWWSHPSGQRPANEPDSWPGRTQHTQTRTRSCPLGYICSHTWPTSLPVYKWPAIFCLVQQQLLSSLVSSLGFESSCLVIRLVSSVLSLLFCTHNHGRSRSLRHLFG